MGTVLVVQRLFAWYVLVPVAWVSLLTILAVHEGGSAEIELVLLAMAMFAGIAIAASLVVQLLCHLIVRRLGTRGGTFCPTCGQAIPHTSPRTTPQHVAAGPAGGH